MSALHVTPTRAFPWFWTFRVQEEGGEMATLHLSLFRSRGAFQVEGESFAAEPEGFFGRAVTLRKGGTVIARAEMASFFRRTFGVTSAGHRLSVESRSWLGREYEVLLGGEPVGSIHAQGFLGRKLTLELPERMPSGAALPYRVLESGLELRGKITHCDDEDAAKDVQSSHYGYSSCSIERSLYIGDVLYTISGSKIGMNDLETLEEIGEISLS